MGRKLIDVPGYTFRLFVTSCADVPAEIWRDYYRRADLLNASCGVPRRRIGLTTRNVAYCRRFQIEASEVSP